eukprot:167618_1
MYREYIVIFNDEKQFNLFKNMRFFSKTIFRDYTRKNQCILIPLNRNIKIRKASKKNGTNAFLVSNADGDRKWYFNLQNRNILCNWMRVLCTETIIKTKNKNRNRSQSTNNIHNKKEIKNININMKMDIMREYKIIFKLCGS